MNRRMKASQEESTSPKSDGHGLGRNAYRRFGVENSLVD